MEAVCFTLGECSMRSGIALTYKVQQATVGQNEQMVVARERDSLRDGLSLWECWSGPAPSGHTGLLARLAAEHQLDVVAKHTLPQSVCVSSCQWHLQHPV